MKLKLDENGNAVLKDGHPVYVHDDGTEAAFDAAAAASTIKARNAEAKANRERAEAAETKLKAFDGIDDAEAARKALGVVKNLDDKKLVDAGEVERLKAEILKTAQEKIAAAEAKAATVEQQLHKEIVGGAFSRSKFIADKLAIPADIVQATFGQHFKVGENGKLVATDAQGNPITSKTRMGEPADFDEAMETIVGSYAHRDAILKADNKSGSGTRNTDGGSGGGKSMKRAAFEALDPAGRMKHMTDGGTIVD